MREELMSEEQEIAAIKAAQSGNISERNRLVEVQYSYVKSTVRGLARHSEARLHQDLVQEGVLGLLDAIARFDEHKHIRLSAYSYQWIRGRVFTYLRNHGNGLLGFKSSLQKEERAVYYKLMRLGRVSQDVLLTEVLPDSGLSLDEIVAIYNILQYRAYEFSGDELLTQFDVGQLSIEDEIARREESEMVNRLAHEYARKLKDSHRMIFERRWLVAVPESYSDLAARTGLSDSWVKNLDKRILRNFRKFINNQKVF